MNDTGIDPSGRRMLNRMTLFGAAVGIVGALTLLALRGPRWGGGFLVGAVFSLLGLEWWKAIGRGLGSSAKGSILGSATLLILRLPVVALAVYVIIRISGIASGAVMAGLLVSTAGIVLEVLYEAVSQKF
jgi:hypothetical protein